MVHRLNDHSLAGVVGAFMSLAAQAGPTCEMEWSGPLGDGPNGQVWSMTVFDDGNGPQLYIGGGFSTFGDLPAPVGVVKWNGATLSLGPPVPEVQNMVVYDDGTGPALYLANNDPVKKWDGRSLTEIPGSPSAYNLTVYDDGSGPKLITCGGFGTGSIHQWEGIGWTLLGGFGGLASSGVYELASLGSYLYVGGFFAPNSLVRWDGREWWGAGGKFGFCSQVGMLAPHDTPLGPRLFVAGSDTCGLSPWDPVQESWDSPIPFSGGGVMAMASFDNGTGSALWVVGSFTSIAGLPAQGIARFDGVDSWTTVLPGADDQIRTAAVFDDGSGPALYVGGSFTSVGGVRAEGVARLDCPPVFGDLDGDGFVNGFDLALLLGQWTGAALYSPCPPHAPADLDHNCKIQGADLAILLSWWTPALR